MLDPAQQQMLDRGLEVSSVAVKTGQPVAAGRMYETPVHLLPERPGTETRTGLYGPARPVTLRPADALFTEASSLATLPALKAEALLGAGRASLGREDLATARTHFLAAAELATGTSVAPWVHERSGGRGRA